MGSTRAGSLLAQVLHTIEPKSATCVHEYFACAAHVGSKREGFLYVEARSEKAVASAVDGLRGILRSRALVRVPHAEMTDAIAVRGGAGGATAGLVEGAWVRCVGQGGYRGDLGRVVEGEAGGVVGVAVVPRVDYTMLAQRCAAAPSITGLFMLVCCVAKALQCGWAEVCLWRRKSTDVRHVRGHVCTRPRHVHMHCAQHLAAAVSPTAALQGGGPQERHQAGAVWRHAQRQGGLAACRGAVQPGRGAARRPGAAHRCSTTPPVVARLRLLRWLCSCGARPIIVRFA